MQYELKFNSDTRIKFKQQDIIHTNMLIIGIGTQSLKNGISIDKSVKSFS